MPSGRRARFSSRRDWRRESTSWPCCSRVAEKRDFPAPQRVRQLRARRAFRPALRSRKGVGVNLARVQKIRERVDHRHRARRREFVRLRCGRRCARSDRAQNARAPGPCPRWFRRDRAGCRSCSEKADCRPVRGCRLQTKRACAWRTSKKSSPTSDPPAASAPGACPAAFQLAGQGKQLGQSDRAKSVSLRKCFMEAKGCKPRAQPPTSEK
jgi:hypothetical protein